MLSDFQVISIKNFYKSTFLDQIRINRCIERNYKSHPPTSNTYNFPLKFDDTTFFSKLYNEFLVSCTQIFGNFTCVSGNNDPLWSNRNKAIPWCYRSHRKDCTCIWHNHLYTSTINGVYYHQIDGDGISFQRNGKKYSYTPDQGELLIFPSYLDHLPHMVKSKKIRYSINVEIRTEESPKELFDRVF